MAPPSGIDPTATHPDPGKDPAGADGAPAATLPAATAPAPDEDLDPAAISPAEESDILESLDDALDQKFKDVSDDSARSALTNFDKQRVDPDTKPEELAEAPRADFSPDEFVSLIQRTILDLSDPNVRLERDAIEQYLAEEFGKDARGEVLIPEHLSDVWKIFDKNVDRFLATNEEKKGLPLLQMASMIYSMRLAAQGIDPELQPTLNQNERLLSAWLGERAMEGVTFIREAIADNRSNEAAAYLSQISKEGNRLTDTLVALKVLGVTPKEVLGLLSESTEAGPDHSPIEVEDLVKAAAESRRAVQLEARFRQNLERMQERKPAAPAVPAPDPGPSKEEVQELHDNIIRVFGRKALSSALEFQKLGKDDKAVEAAFVLRDVARDPDRFAKTVLALNALGTTPEEVVDLISTVKREDFRGRGASIPELVERVQQVKEEAPTRGDQRRYPSGRR